MRQVVVALLPLIAQNPYFFQCFKQVGIQYIFPEGSVQSFDIGVLLLFFKYSFTSSNCASIPTKIAKSASLAALLNLFSEYQISRID